MLWHHLVLQSCYNLSIVLTPSIFISRYTDVKTKELKSVSETRMPFNPLPAGHSYTMLHFMGFVWTKTLFWKKKWEATVKMTVQYIPRNMHTVFALLCFVVVIHWLIFPYPSGLLHWHCGNLTIAPVPAKQPWWIWINTSCEFIMNDCITTTKQSTTKPCAYFLGYTVCPIKYARQFCYRFHWSDHIIQKDQTYLIVCMELKPFCPN